jgi:hypothetical protein
MLRFKLFSLRCGDFADSGVIFDCFVTRMSENSDIVSTNNIRTITLVTDGKLRVLVPFG